MPELEQIASYAELLAAVADDPLVVDEVGPDLLAPPLRLGEAVLFARESQLGQVGAVVLGPAPDAKALLTSAWRATAGWEGVRSLTAPRRLRSVLEAIGLRGFGDWETMSIRPDELRRRPTPADVRVQSVSREEARSFVAEHHTTYWLTPNPIGEAWIGLRHSATGELLGTGLAAYTPTGATRLTSIAIDRSHRGQGLGWALTQALVELGFTRSETVILGVDEDNVAGRGLYAAMGFRLDHALVSGVLPPLRAKLN